MNTRSQIKVIVPDKSGVEALGTVDEIEIVVVGPNASIPEEAKDAEILVVGPAEAQSEVEAVLRKIEQLPNLKLLQTLGQGTDQWDDTLPKELIVSTARGAHGGSVAEWVMMMLLAHTRELPYFMNRQAARTWEGKRTKTLMNMNVLIYGAGDLGRNIQKRLEPFGASITMVGGHSEGDVIDTASAHKLLPTADAVIVVLPLIPATKHIVDTSFLAQLPDGAIVINAGRGELVDQAALLTELERGRLKAALDVMTPEPLPSDSPLWSAPNVLVTPHVGGNSDGADTRAWQMARKQIKAYIQGDLQKN